jgi:hypothetical protein
VIAALSEELVYLAVTAADDDAIRHSEKKASVNNPDDIKERPLQLAGFGRRA